MKARVSDSENPSRVRTFIQEIAFFKSNVSHQAFSWAGSKTPLPQTSSNFLMRSNVSNTTAEIKISLVGEHRQHQKIPLNSVFIKKRNSQKMGTPCGFQVLFWQKEEKYEMVICMQCVCNTVCLCAWGVAKGGVSHRCSFYTFSARDWKRSSPNCVSIERAETFSLFTLPQTV